MIYQTIVENVLLDLHGPARRLLEVLGKHAQLSHRIYDGESLEVRASRQPDAATCKLVRSLGVSFVPEVLRLDHPQGERVRNLAALDPQKKFLSSHKGLSKRDAGVWERRVLVLGSCRFGWLISSDGGGCIVCCGFWNQFRCSRCRRQWLGK